MTRRGRIIAGSFGLAMGVAIVFLVLREPGVEIPRASQPDLPQNPTSASRDDPGLREPEALALARAQPVPPEDSTPAAGTDHPPIVAELRHFVVSARDRDGQAVSGVQVTLLADRWDRDRIAWRQGDESGHARLPVPDRAFLVGVEAPGYDRIEAGPFQYATMPERFEVLLTRLPGVHGIVRHEGTPVAGAFVSLQRAFDDSSWIVDGFPSRSARVPHDSSETRQDGCFSLTLREAGIYYIRAAMDDLAPSEVGPIALDPSVIADGFEFDLGLGGSIEGRVVMPPGESPDEVTVGISRGDGHSMTQSSDRHGRFRFTHLTPGPWHLARAREAITPGLTLLQQREAHSEPIPFNCTVHEGEVTRFDLDLTALPKLTLEGRFLLGGRPAAGWRARLKDRDHQALPGRPVLDSDGRFSITADAPGSYHLELDPAEDSRAPSFGTQVGLSSERTSWEVDLPVSSISGTIASWLVADGGSVSIRWEGKDLSMWGEVRPDGDGRYSLDAVPVGVLVFLHSGKELHRPLKAVKLTAGASLAVDLP